jgi:exodeoxyribonuclease VII large subunit
VLRDYTRRLDVAASRIRHFDFRQGLALTRARLDAVTAALLRATRASVVGSQVRLEKLSATLDALSPVKILDRGYALVFNAGGALVKDAGQLKPGEEISARLARGSFSAEIKETKT